MNWVKFAIVAYVATIFQIACVPVILPQPIRPNVLIVVAGFYLLTAPRHQAFIATVILAALADLTSLSPLGSQVIAFVVFALLAQAIRPLVFTDLPIAHAFTAFVGYLAVTIVYRIIVGLVPHAVPLTGGMIHTLLQAAATAVVAAAVCKLFVRSMKPIR